MIKAKEAKAISRSVELDQHTLDQIMVAIIAEASQGNYSANITGIVYGLPHDYTYIEYLEELGYSIKHLDHGRKGTYVHWY